MHAVRLACPHCGVILKSTKPLRLGKQISCVKCAQPFTIRAETQRETSAVSTGASLLLPMEQLRDLYDDASDTASEGTSIIRARRRRRSRAGVVFGVGLLLAFIAGGVALAVVCLREDPATGPDGSDANTQRPPLAAGPAPDRSAKLPMLPVTLDNKKPEKSAPPKEKEPSDIVAAKHEPKDVAPLNPDIKPAVFKPAAPPELKLGPDPAAKLAVKKPLDQGRINAAIERGVRFLQTKASPKGTWLEKDDEHAIGYAALPALALLECQVPTSDPAVKNAADFVRKHHAKLTDTYDLGLAVVFLDRLGDPRDRALIRTLALRLVAGQTPAGGWDYQCPLLTPAETDQLQTYLQAHRPKYEFLNPLAGKAAPSVKPKAGAGKKDELPATLRKLPLIVNQQSKDIQDTGRDDNSNTQFGLLGLWAARRHDVPVELCLGLAAKRFQQTQKDNGGWGYARHGPSKNSMTCVGLLGLAMGHGVAADAFRKLNPKAEAPPPADDRHIKQALSALGHYLDGDSDAKGLETRIDLYYLWTLERVGILYKRDTFGKKDWYRWGCDIILPSQRDDGGWQDHYTPVVDTSFALLFLRRSNLVRDLNLYLAIPRPDRPSNQ